MIVARVLPEWEWPRIAETGCTVDLAWQEKAIQGCVVVVECGQNILAIAFVFLTADRLPHVDGLWIKEGYRGLISVLRPLRRGIKFAVDHLGGASRTVSVEAAVWMTRPERRAHGVEFIGL